MITNAVEKILREHIYHERQLSDNSQDILLNEQKTVKLIQRFVAKKGKISYNFNMIKNQEGVWKRKQYKRTGEQDNRQGGQTYEENNEKNVTRSVDALHAF